MCQPCLRLSLPLSLLSPRCLSFIWSYSLSPASISSSLLSLSLFFFFSWFLTVAFRSPPVLSPPYLSLFVSTSVNIFAACFSLLSLSLFLFLHFFSHPPFFVSLIVFRLFTQHVYMHTREKRGRKKKRVSGRNQVMEIGQHIGSSPSYIKVLDRSTSVCRCSWNQLLEQR